MLKNNRDEQERWYNANKVHTGSQMAGSCGVPSLFVEPFFALPLALSLLCYVLFRKQPSALLYAPKHLLLLLTLVAVFISWAAISGSGASDGVAIQTRLPPLGPVLVGSGLLSVDLGCL